MYIIRFISPPVQVNDGDIVMGNLDDQEFAPNPLDEFGGVNAMDPAPIPQNRFDTGMVCNHHLGSIYITNC